jgi:ABC-2 type transport system permease protein
MSESFSSRWFTLVQRELQEYRVSLVWTPVVIALVLVTVMGISVLLSDRIAAVGQGFVEVIIRDNAVSELNIRIEIDDEAAEEGISYRIAREPAPVDESRWNFSRDWTFKPQPRPDDGAADAEASTTEDQRSFNLLLSVVNALMMLVLVLVTTNYLLYSLFDDRRDRSILFWKSMPVSEWEVVLSKLAVALLVAPAVFLGVSLLLQLAVTLLSMLMLWRADMDPFAQVLDTLDIGRLLRDQFGGWLLGALWVAPFYAWLLAASAAARRSPLLTAVVPVLGLWVLERLLLGTEFVGTAIKEHLPPLGGITASGAALTESGGSSGALPSLAGGLVIAAILVFAAVWLRRHRWEI